MVTFSNIAYHVALQEDDAQNKLFQEILALPNIETEWNGPAVEMVFRNWLAARK